MQRLRLPAFVHDVIDDPRQRGILVAGSIVLFAVGLVPRALSPSLPTVQEALRTEPELQSLFLLLVFIGTVAIVVGGLVSDLLRRRGLLLGSLATMVVASLVASVIDDGNIFYLANLAGVIALGIALSYGIGSVAIAYEGVPRATALGAVYAAYGAGTAASPALLTLFPQVIPSTTPGTAPGFTFVTWPAYVLTAIVAAVAFWAAHRWMPAIPGALPARRTVIIELGAWTIAILAIVSGVLGFTAPGARDVPIALVVGGAVALVVLATRLRRTAAEAGRLGVDQRGLGAALAVGVAVGFAQAIPLMFMPSVFQYSLGYGPLFSMLAIAPFAIALFLAGPVAGILMQRFGPRGMMTIGTAGLGVANLLLALALIFITGEVRSAFAADPSGGASHLDALNYLFFIVPLAAIGAGFVLSTTVRTAIVFASTPRNLPASAAAINEASVGLGSRIGIVTAAGALTAAAMASARAMVDGLPADRAQALVVEFQAALVSVGTPRFQAVVAGSLEDAPAIKVAAYSVAYLDGVIVTLLISAIAGIGGAIVAWVLTGRRDPLRTVFDMQEERAAQQGDELGVEAAPSSGA